MPALRGYFGGAWQLLYISFNEFECLLIFFRSHVIGRMGRLIRYNRIIMRKFKEGFLHLRDVVLPDWSAPVFIFLVCFYSFGVLSSRLGFFQDDWHHVFQAYWYGIQGLQRFLLTDRGPFAYLIYGFFFRILGFSPANWHWSLMLIRFMTVGVFWLALRQIWPGRDSLTSWLALSFAIYPIFTLQPLSVAYTLHWAMYFVFMLSLFLMLYAIQHAKTYLPLTVLAVLLEVFHLICIEYFSGLELSRPIFLWLLFFNLSGRERFKKALRYSLPFLITLALYAVYRSSYSLLFGFDRFALLAALSGLARSPLSSLATVLQYMLQDFVYIVFSQWYSAIDPKVIDLARGSTYLIFGSVFGFAIAAYFVISRLAAVRKEPDLSGSGRQVAVAGILSVVLAILPFWIAGFSIFQKNLLWSERLALSAMPGASMIVTGAIYALIDRPPYRHLILSLLLGLGIGLQVQTARNYQASWDKQEQFYWQLHWRAPSLQANTLIVSDQEILFYMGIYPTAFAINLLYPQVLEPPAASYWFNAGFEHVNWDKFVAGEPVTFEKYTETFTATTQDVLAITFEPGLDQCLWILRPDYSDIRGLTPEAQTWLTVSNLSRIQSAPEVVPPPEIFGKEPEHTWCYYYEKADLAGQFKQWDRIVQLWQEAGQNGVRAKNSIELLPFIRAYGELNDWESARRITLQAEVLPDRSSSILCDLWRELGSTAPPSTQRDQTAAQVEGQLGCQK